MYGIKSAKTVMYLVSKYCLKFSIATAPIAYSHANNILSFNKKRERGREREICSWKKYFQNKRLPCCSFYCN